jgi:hypothetical protein
MPAANSYFLHPSARLTPPRAKGFSSFMAKVQGSPQSSPMSANCLRQRELKAEQERNETELRIAIQRAKVAAQFAKRFRRFSLALGVLLLFALGTAGYAFWEQTTARARDCP